MELSKWADVQTKAPRLSEMSDWVSWIDTSSPLYANWLKTLDGKASEPPLRVEAGRGI